MKIRKHKNNRTFLITFNTRSPGRTETHVDENGKARKVVTAGVLSPVGRVWATGSCKQSVLKAFLTGRDAGNITTIIREAKPIAIELNGLPTLWTGRLIRS